LPLKREIIQNIKAHQGSGIIVSNQEVIHSLKYLKDFNTGPESALTFAGYLQVKNNFKIGNFPVILLSGTKR
jgi:hypothetical protein